MIRILQMTSVLNVGGVESMIMRLYRCIDKESFYYDFLTFGGLDHYYYENEIKQIGGKVFRVPKRSESFIAHHSQIYRLAKNGGYDAVHIHATNSYFAAMQVFALRLAGMKNIIVHSHNTSDWRQTKSRHRFLNAAAKMYMKHAVKLRVSCSRAAAVWLFGSSDGVEIFPLPVECQRFRFDEGRREQFRREHGFEGKKIYVHVGRFDDQKNHGFLIRSFKQLTELEQDSILFLIGDGPLRQDIEALINSLGLKDKIVLWGNIDDVDEKLNASDIFLLPSKYEGLPTVAIEAQSVGLPCLISDSVTDEIKITAAAEQIPLSIGEKAWAEKMSGIRPLSYEERRRANDTVAGIYDIKKVTAELEQMYRNISGK